MLPLLLFYLVIINALAFLIMLADKQKAKKHLWRIPEATLLTVAILGGSVGSLAGMRFFIIKRKSQNSGLGSRWFWSYRFFWPRSSLQKCKTERAHIHWVPSVFYIGSD